MESVESRRAENYVFGAHEYMRFWEISQEEFEEATGLHPDFVLQMIEFEDVNGYDYLFIETDFGGFIFIKTRLPDGFQSIQKLRSRNRYESIMWSIRQMMEEGRDVR